MSITVSNVQSNHRGVYAEFTGDGSTTAIPITLTAHYPGRNVNGVATVTTAPTAFSHRSGKGGFYFPHGTDAAISSTSVSGSTLTINTTAAIGNGTKAYCCFVFNESSARN